MNYSETTPEPPASASSNAMQAFRRGIDRRAYVLARAQCGDNDLLRSALSGVDHDFNNEYAQLPISQWPIRFWTLLLSRKELLQGQSPWPALASIGHGPRAALLLRLVAGLDFPHAAQVLKISEATYRFALERGLEQLHAAGFDFQELERLRDAFLDEVKRLPDDLIAPTENAASIAATPELITQARPQAKNTMRWLGLLLFLALVAGLLLGWWYRQPMQTVLRSPMAMTAIQAAVTHPDYEVIAHQNSVEQSGDVAFLSWFAAGAPEQIMKGPELMPDSESIDPAIVDDVKMQNEE